MSRIVICLVATILISMLGWSAGWGEGADYVNLKLLVPVDGLEYEHVTPAGLGLSLAVTYIPTTDFHWSYAQAGVKKYLGGDIHGFFLGGYAGAGKASANTYLGYVTYDTYGTYRIPVWNQVVTKGSASFASFLATFGYRGAWGHFTLLAELGAGVVTIGQIKTSSTEKNPLTGRPFSDTYDLSLGGILPCLQLGLGYRF